MSDRTETTDEERMLDRLLSRIDRLRRHLDELLAGYGIVINE